MSRNREYNFSSVRIFHLQLFPSIKTELIGIQILSYTLSVICMENQKLSNNSFKLKGKYLWKSQRKIK